MSTRGTSQAMSEKKIINHDRGGTFVMCAWSDCDRDGFQLYSAMIHEHAGSIDCDSSLAKHVTYVFCSERHKAYWVHSSGAMARDLEARYGGRIAGMLPPGMRKMIG